MPITRPAHQQPTNKQGSNRAKLKTAMRTQHDAVDQYINSYISSHPSPTQAYADFLAIMNFFWTSLYGSDHWLGQAELLLDTHCLSCQPLIEPSGPIQEFPQINSCAVEYLFWGSAMGSRQLKQIFTSKTDKQIKLPFHYFDYLRDHQALNWSVTLAQVEKMTALELQQCIRDIQKVLTWLLILMQTSLKQPIETAKLQQD